MSETIISIDLGTTRLKVAGFGLDGTLQHLLIRRHSHHAATVDGAERRWQRADGWWQDTVHAIRELGLRLAGSEIVGISLSGRGGAAVFADASGRVVADPWSDDRHLPQLEELRRWRGQDGPLSSYAAALIAKYQWLRQMQPDRAAAVAHAFYAKDWLLYRLTGVHRTDWSSGPDRPRWDPALAGLELPEALLPEPAVPWSLAGTLSDESAAALGLSASVPVAVGAHDGLAANIGAGAIRPGDFAITLGTHAVVRGVADRQPPGSFRFYGLPPATHILGGNALMAGRAVDWVLELTGMVAEGAERSGAYRRLAQLAAGVPAGARGARFFPYLDGQVAPARRPRARAALLGMTLQHGAAEVCRAVLEGGCFAVRGVFDQVAGWCGEPQRIRLTGGGAESPLWCGLLAAVLDRPLELTGQAVEARGAAMCLSVALGLHPDLETAAREMVRVEERIEADPEDAALYQRLYRDWQALDAGAGVVDFITAGQ